MRLSRRCGGSREVLVPLSLQKVCGGCATQRELGKILYDYGVLSFALTLQATKPIVFERFLVARHRIVLCVLAVKELLPCLEVQEARQWHSLWGFHRVQVQQLEASVVKEELREEGNDTTTGRLGSALEALDPCRICVWPWLPRPLFFCLCDTAEDSSARCRLGWTAGDGIDRTLLGDDERCLGTGWYCTTQWPLGCWEGRDTDWTERAWELQIKHACG